MDRGEESRRLVGQGKAYKCRFDGVHLAWSWRYALDLLRFLDYFRVGYSIHAVVLWVYILLLPNAKSLYVQTCVCVLSP
jgi:hypothetical protein